MNRFFSFRGRRFLGFAAAVILTIVAVQSCARAKKVTAPGVVEGRLTDCPSSPNCVSSVATDPDRYIEPFRPVAGQTIDDLLFELWKAVAELPRSRVTKDDGDYLAVEYRSRIFGFIDDLELYAVREEGLVHVRSAARTGHSDFDVNRKRVEAIRERISAGS